MKSQEFITTCKNTRKWDGAVLNQNICLTYWSIKRRKWSNSEKQRNQIMAETNVKLEHRMGGQYMEGKTTSESTCNEDSVKWNHRVFCVKVLQYCRWCCTNLTTETTTTKSCRHFLKKKIETRCRCSVRRLNKSRAGKTYCMSCSVRCLYCDYTVTWITMKHW